jgi:hypothetical protein
MTIDANSYGSVDGVAALTKRFTNNGSFDTTTTPTLTHVEGFIDAVSATLNMALAGEGFAIPVSQATAKAALDSVVVEAASDLVQAANSTGRFFTEKALERGVSPLRAVRRELAEWVESQINGFSALGVSRNTGTTSGILSRESDEDSNEVSPLFTRKGFGQTNGSLGVSSDDE